MGEVRRVILDTNMLVAAANNPDSAGPQVVEACLSGRLPAAIPFTAHSRSAAGRKPPT